MKRGRGMKDNRLADVAKTSRGTIMWRSHGATLDTPSCAASNSIVCDG